MPKAVDPPENGRIEAVPRLADFIIDMSGASLSLVECH